MRKIDLDNVTAEDFFIEISKSIKDTIQKFAPLRRVNYQRKDTWITINITIAINKRNNFLHLWLNSPPDENKLRYQRSRNDLTEKIRKQKKVENMEKIGTKACPRKLFRVFRSTTKDDMVIHKNPEPDELNDYFAKIGRTLSDRIEQATEMFSVEIVVGSMALFPTNCDEIANILSPMIPKKVMVMMVSVTKC